jgi:hypothetical protein
MIFVPMYHALLPWLSEVNTIYENSLVDFYTFALFKALKIKQMVNLSEPLDNFTWSWRGARREKI